MAKAQKKTYICQSCGSVFPRWMGKCESCHEWNTIVEETAEAGPPKALNAGGASSKSGRVLEFSDLKTENKTYPRVKTGTDEFDRVTGGGLVPGSVTLIGGDPGIGKSTLLLQMVCALAKDGKRCVYISGEEAEDQIRMRANRLGVDKVPVALASATSVRDIVTTLEKAETKPDCVVIDSIQTMYVDTVDSAPGTVTQVRTSTQELVRVAKRLGIAMLIVGHVTKEGTIAGPRVLEHIVDTVLYFEGERSHQFRILRTVKNRFGPTDEIGVFEMVGIGLEEVKNPSALFLSQRSQDVAGSCVFAGLEGSRPVLVEIQALVAETPFSTPRRAVVGWDSARLSMILAVLEARCGIHFSGYDVYLNVAGGLRIQEPAADMAVAAALISAITNDPVAADTVIFGEIGLTGEIRTVPQMDLRAKEASKLGFKACFSAPHPKKSQKQSELNTKIFNHIQELAQLFPKPARRRHEESEV